jgi:hypothetical protein
MLKHMIRDHDIEGLRNAPSRFACVGNDPLLTPISRRASPWIHRGFLNVHDPAGFVAGESSWNHSASHSKSR